MVKNAGKVGQFSPPPRYPPHINPGGKREAKNPALKGQCHEIFDLYFFSLIEPIWAPDKQAKIVFLKNSFLRRYLNLKFEKIDSAQANTVRS